MTDELAELVVSRLRDVADFPEPGILYKDITPLLADPVAFRAAVVGLAASGRRSDTATGAAIQAVAGVEARGFILGAPVALELGVPFVPLRKAGKLPWRSVRAAYTLEYGTAELELHEDALRPGQGVLVVDDVLATGGTLAAAVQLVRTVGAVPVEVAVLLELEALGGRERVPVPVRALAST